MNTQRISLDISKIIDVPPVVRIGQGDNAGTTIVARIFDNGTSTNLDGMTARFCMRLPDGTHYVRDSECTVSGNTVTYVVDESHCAAVKGMTDEVYFDILADGEIVYSTSRFSVHVLRGVTDGAVPGETYDSSIEEAIQRANEAAEAAEEAAGGVTPLMSASTLGGAKLGDGLTLTGESLGVSPITTAQIDTIANDGSVMSTNVLNGTRLTYLWSKIKAKFAAKTHSHAATDITSGTLPIARGGTGATTAADAAENIVDGQAIEPASVAATGEVSAKSGATTHKLTEKAEDAKVDRFQASLAPVESTTATTNHSIGDTFMLDGSYRRATRAIAAGETINDTNSSVTNMNDKIANVWNNSMVCRDEATGDYNDYKSIGIYIVKGGMTANKPTDTGSTTGILAVYSDGSTGGVTKLVLQLYFATSSKAFFRLYDGSSIWSPWMRLATA